MNRTWTEKEKEFVIENYLTMTFEEIGKKIDRTAYEVHYLYQTNPSINYGVYKQGRK